MLVSAFVFCLHATKAGFSHVEAQYHNHVFYSSRDTIVNCMKSHLQKCMNEEQAMFLGTGQEYAAAYDCLCALHDAGELSIVIPVLSGHSKTRPKLFFNTNCRLMQVKSIAECSKGSILQYFRPSLSYHFPLRPLFCLFLSDRLRQVYCILF